MEPPVANSGRGEPIPQPHGGALRNILPGTVLNPSGRPKVGRTVSAAYAELLDTPGQTLKEQLENFRDKRGAKFCASDMVAVGMLTSAVNPSNRGQTAAAGEITDRTEGKVSQGIDVNGSVDLGSSIAAAHARAVGRPG